MAGTKLIPEKITSPIQLMAAWFAMLVLLSSILLTAAINITKPDWAAGYLVIFTSVLIVLVLGCVTLMLTIFRPHLQEGREYARWLKDKNNYSSGLIRSDQVSLKPLFQKRPSKSEKQSVNLKDFPISITDSPDAGELVGLLSKSGFSAEIYEEDFPEKRTFKFQDYEAIWIGSAVPAKVAIDSIKIAVSHWPHLKYIHLSNDGGNPPDYVHKEIYFGGSTSTARSYELSSWSNEELLSLEHNMSREDFHRAIRSKYR